MLREDRGGGVEEGGRVFYVENSSVRCVVQVCQLRLQHQRELRLSHIHTRVQLLHTVYIKQLIS